MAQALRLRNGGPSLLRTAQLVRSRGGGRKEGGKREEDGSQGKVLDLFFSPLVNQRKALMGSRLTCPQSPPSIIAEVPVLILSPQRGLIGTCHQALTTKVLLELTSPWEGLVHWGRVRSWSQGGEGLVQVLASASSSPVTLTRSL